MLGSTHIPQSPKISRHLGLGVDFCRPSCEADGPLQLLLGSGVPRRDGSEVWDIARGVLASDGGLNVGLLVL